MINLTRLDDTTVVLNALLIERIEETPDTVITLTTGRTVVVRESSDEVVQQAVDYLQGLRTPAEDDGDQQAGGSSAINIAQMGRVTE